MSQPLSAGAASKQPAPRLLPAGGSVVLPRRLLRAMFLMLCTVAVAWRMAQWRGEAWCGLLRNGQVTPALSPPQQGTKDSPARSQRTGKRQCLRTKNRRLKEEPCLLPSPCSHHGKGKLEGKETRKLHRDFAGVLGKLLLSIGGRRQDSLCHRIIEESSPAPRESAVKAALEATEG